MAQKYAKAQVTISSIFDSVAPLFNPNAIQIPSKSDGTCSEFNVSTVLKLDRSGESLRFKITGHSIVGKPSNLITISYGSGFATDITISFTAIDKALDNGVLSFDLLLEEGGTMRTFLSFSKVKEGIQGIDGAVIRTCGEYKSTTTYVCNSTFIDCVIYRANSSEPYKTYRVKKGVSSVIGILPTDTAKWEVFENFKSISTELLLAETAHIGNGTFKGIVIGDVSGSKGWVLNESAITSRSLVNGKNKVALTSEGDLKLIGGSLKVLSPSGAELGTGDTIFNKFDEIYSDGKITPLEKQQIKREWDVIASEFNSLAKYKEHESDTVKSLFNEYQIAYNTLYAYLFTAVIDGNTSPLLANMNETSNIVSNALSNVVSFCIAKKQELINALDLYNKELADDAQSTADQARKEASDVQQNVTNLDGYVKGAFKDGIISNAEAIGIKSQLKALDTEKAEFDASYAKLFSNTYLSDSLKNALTSKKNAYNTAHANLVSAINSAIADNLISPAESDNVDAKFASYKTALSELVVAIGDANNGIQNQLNSNASTAASNAQTNARNHLAKQLGYNSYDEMVAQTGSSGTIIENGYLRTSLIKADAIITNGLSAEHITIPCLEDRKNGISFVDKNNNSILGINSDGIAITKGSIKLGKNEDVDNSEAPYNMVLESTGDLYAKDAKLENVTLRGTIVGESWSVGVDGKARFNNVEIGKWNMDSTGITSGNASTPIEVINAVSNNQSSLNVEANHNTTNIPFDNSANVTIKADGSNLFTLKSPPFIARMNNNLTKDGRKYSRFDVYLVMSLFKDSVLLDQVESAPIVVVGTDARDRYPVISMADKTFTNLSPGTYKIGYALKFVRIPSMPNSNVGTGRGNVSNIRIEYHSRSFHVSQITEYTILSPNLLLMQKSQDEYFKVENLDSGLYVSMKGNISIPGDSVSGIVNVAEIANRTKGTLTAGSKTFNGSADVSINKTDVGLGNVANESKATMFTNPVFTGIAKTTAASNSSEDSVIANVRYVKDKAVEVLDSVTSHSNLKNNPHAVTKAQVGLGNVDNESKQTMFSNPVFTGTPTAPTAQTSANSTQLATTAFVKSAIGELINGAPGALDTLKELSDALGGDANFATTVTNQIAEKLALAGGEMTGILKISTASGPQIVIDGFGSDSGIHLRRSSKDCHDWKILNTGGSLKIQKDNSDGNFYDVISVASNANDLLFRSYNVFHSGNLSIQNNLSYSTSNTTNALSAYQGYLLNRNLITGMVLSPSQLTLRRTIGDITADIPTWNQNTSGNAATATKLQTARTIWGRSFDGTGDVNGAIEGASTGSFSGKITSAVEIQGSRFISSVGTGTAPLSISSSTLVNNLNADLLDGKHASSFVEFNEYVMNTNPFGGKKLFINSIDNAFASADKIWNVTGEISDIDGSNVSLVSESGIRNIFSGSYESQTSAPAGKKLTIKFDFNGNFPGYPYGYIYASFYHTNTPDIVSGRMYCNYEPHGIGWHDLVFSDISGKPDGCIMRARQSKYNMTKLEITITSKADTSANLTQFDFCLDRPDITRLAAVTKYAPQTLYHRLTLNDGLASTTGAFSGIVTSAGFNKNGATDSDILLGNGGHININSIKAGDADKLDGQHGAWYQDLANSTGRLPDARLTGEYSGITNLSMSGVLNASSAEFNSHLRVTSTSGEKRILIGNQDSAGTNKPAIVSASNGTLRFGYGDTWAGYGGNFTHTVVFTKDGKVEIGAPYTLAGERKLTVDGPVQVTGFYFNDCNKANSAPGSLWGVYAWDNELQFTTRNTNGSFRSQPFTINYSNGRFNLTNDLYVAGTAIFAGLAKADRFQSLAANGTAPLIVSSSTKVANLNADLLDGQHSDYFTNASNLSSGIVPDARISGSYTGLDNLTGNGTFKAKFIESWDGACGVRIGNRNGASNTAYTHYETNSYSHWFNKNIFVQGEIWAGPLYNKQVWHAGNSNHGEADWTARNIIVKGSLTVDELIANQVRGTNGDLMVSDTAKIKSFSGRVITIDGETNDYNPFIVGDIIICKRFNASNKEISKYYKVRVDAVSGLTLTVSQNLENTTGALAIGDIIVRYTSSNANRKGIIYIASSSSGAPYIDTIYDGSIKARFGKLDGITDSTLGALNGYGLYADNAFLKGKIIATSGEFTGKITSASGAIGGWSINPTTISKNNVSLGADGSIANSGKWLLANDGSGNIACNKIRWNTAGDVTFDDSVKLLWRADIDRLQIGGRNLIFKPEKWQSLGGFSIDKTNPYRVSDVDGNYYFPFRSNKIKVSYGETYTLSFLCSDLSGVFYAEVWVHNSKNYRKQISSGRNIFTFTINEATEQEVEFRIFGASETTSLRVVVENIQFEEGSKATSWIAAPEDSPLTYIDANGIYTGTLTATQVNAVAINAGSITTGTLSADRINVGSLNGNKITAGTITAKEIAAGTITADKITTGSITATQIAAETITGNKIAANTITAKQIAANTITAAEIVGGTITGDKIAANAITADKISANAVTTDKLYANAVTAAKIAVNAITADKITSGAISWDKLASDVKAKLDAAFDSDGILLPSEKHSTLQIWADISSSYQVNIELAEEYINADSSNNDNAKIRTAINELEIAYTTLYAYLFTAIHEGNTEPLLSDMNTSSVVVSVSLRNVISNYFHKEALLESSKGTTIISGGYIKTNRIKAGSILANMIDTENLVVKNTASIGNWIIKDDALTGSNVGLATDAIWLGGSKTSAPFRVTNTGALVATNATITGVITATSGSFTGTVNAANGYFRGDITGASGTIGGVVLNSGGISVAGKFTLNSSGLTMSAGSINIANKFKVDDSGNLVATGANITGVITATSGSFNGTVTALDGNIGGWLINEEGLSSSNISIIPDGGIKAFGIKEDKEVQYWSLSPDGTAKFASSLEAAELIATGGQIGGWSINQTGLSSGVNVTGKNPLPSGNLLNSLSHNQGSISGAANVNPGGTGVFGVKVIIGEVSSNLVTINGNEADRFSFLAPGVNASLRNALSKNGDKYSCLYWRVGISVIKCSSSGSELSVIDTRYSPAVTMLGTDADKKNPWRSNSLPLQHFNNLPSGYYKFKFFHVFEKFHNGSGNGVGSDRGSITDMYMAIIPESGDNKVLVGKDGEYSQLSTDFWMMKKSADKFFSVETTDNDVIVTINGTLNVTDAFKVTNSSDSDRLGGQLPTYYAPASSLNNYLLKSAISSWALASSKPSYSWNEINGTVPTWNQNTTGKSASSDKVNSLSSNLTNPIQSGFVYASQIVKSTEELFQTGNNANAVLTFNTHGGDYYHQLGFNSVGNIYSRHFNGSPLTTTGIAWRLVLDSNNTKFGTDATGYRPLTINGVTENVSTSDHTHSNYASSISTTGSGNAVTGVAISGNTITVTKGATYNNYIHPSLTARSVGGAKHFITSFTSNGEGHVTGISTAAMSKADIEGLLVGNIASHSHSYLPLSGGTISGQFIFESSLTTNFKEGIRLNQAGSGWGGIVFGGPRGSVDGCADAWWAARTPGKDFMIAFGTANETGGLLLSTGGMSWKGNTIYHSGNTNKTSIDWSAKSLSLSGPIVGATTGSFSGSITSSGNITAPTFIGALSGNATSATNATDSTKLGGAYLKDILPLSSIRDFTKGTLIKTSIDYSNENGHPWYLRITGNIYGNGRVLNLSAQGYIYNNTIINHNCVYSGTFPAKLIALNVGGKLCFWFERQGYWCGYNVECIIAHSGQKLNTVVSIEDSDDPGGTKRVEITPVSIYDSANSNTSTVSWRAKDLVLNGSVTGATTGSFSGQVTASLFKGAIQLPNSVWNTVGDDAAIGDINLGGCLGVKGLNRDYGGIVFYGSSDAKQGVLIANSGSLLFDDNKVYHAGNSNLNTIDWKTKGLSVSGDVILNYDSASSSSKEIRLYNNQFSAAIKSIGGSLVLISGLDKDTLTVGSDRITVKGTTQASGFIKESSNDSHILLGGGGHININSIKVGDADKLDGQHGSWYQDLANATGVLPDARLTGSYTGLANLTMSGLLTTSSIEATSHIRITSTGGNKRLLMGNQNSAGVNKPCILFSSNANFSIGYGDTWNGDGGNFTTNAIFTHDGKLGIGTLNPTEKLDVSGNIRIGNTTGDASLELFRQGNASWRMLNTGGVLKFQTNYISSAGSYYDAMSLTYSSGNMWLKGEFTAPVANIGYANSSYALSASTAIIDSWIRTNGASGWYSQSYHGGIHMTESTTVKVYGSKKFGVYSADADSINTTGGVKATTIVEAGTKLTTKGKELSFNDEASVIYNSETKTIQFIFN